MFAIAFTVRNFQRWAIGIIGLCLLVSPLAGQAPPLEERPKPFAPKRPTTRTELNRRESLHQYTLGLLCQREDRLLEALKAFQEAGRLDPEAAAVFKAQVPILLALDRARDAQAALRRVLALDPADYESWFVAARIHKTLTEYVEARKCLNRGLEAPGLAENPELAQQMYLDLGQLCETAEEFPQAIAALRAAAKILDHPDLLMERGPIQRETILAQAADTHERIAGLHRRLKQFDEALTEYKKAQAQSPERAGRLNLHLAQLCLEQFKLDQALPFLDAYLRMQPLGMEAYELKIDVLRRLNRAEAIVPWLERASGADRNNVGLKLLLAKQYAVARRFAPAEKIYSALADEAPSPEVFKGMFTLYKSQPQDGMTKALELLNATVAKAKEKGPPGLAAQQARAMIAALEDDGELSKELVRVGMQQMDFKGKLQFDTVHLLGVLADRHKKLEEAEAFYRKGLSMAPQRPATEALLYSGLLRILWKGHRHEQILELCNKGLDEAQATNHILFYNDRARAFAMLGKVEDALRTVDKAIDLAGDNDRLTVRRLKVRLLLQAGDNERAEAECQDMLKEFRQPGETLEIRYLLSNVFSAKRQHDKAEEQLETILKADPDNPTANNDLGYMWADRNKKLPEAEALIRRALDADRRQRRLSRASAEPEADLAAYVDSLGWVLFRRGRIDEARQELERAARLDGGEDPVIFDHLGDVYFRLDQSAQARTAWEKALHLYHKDKHRRMEDRQREVQRKLKALDSAMK